MRLPPRHKAPPRGPSLDNAHCSGCGWSIELHPLDAEGVDVGRCPTEAESQMLEDAQSVLRPAQMRMMAQSFPRAAR